MSRIELTMMNLEAASHPPTDYRSFIDTAFRIYCFRSNNPARSNAFSLVASFKVFFL